MALFRSSFFSDDHTILGKIRLLAWGQVFCLCLYASIGFLCLYSAAGGNLEPWASRQIVRFMFALGVLMAIALTDIKWLFRIAYPFHGVVIIMLVMVDIFGHIGMGAQRWLDLGIMKLQPSELAKISTVLCLARFYHGKELHEVKQFKNLFIPAMIILLPVGLVIVQPDLGTGLAVMMAGTAIIFAGGVSIWLFIFGGIAAIAAIPIIWQFMHEYQQKRVLTFLDPESDPLGSGFHITQSKIALGSGGITGKGYLEGTQSHLNFLPEKHTDFVFTLWAEEWGLIGGLFLLGLLGMIILYGYWIAFRCRSQFARLLAFGLTINFSIYIFINIGMVMGLLPVVGIPLPMMSYGGTAMLSVMAAFGMIQCCNVHRDTRLPKGF
jgi:rod shape determining protein RodA